MRKTKASKPGFTLAETFLCVFLVGTIAAIVTSALYKKSADVTMKSELRQAYTTLEQATNALLADRNDQFGNLVGLFTDNNNMLNTFSSYLNYTKKCYQGSTSGICWPNVYYPLNSPGTTYNWNGATAILNNGMLLGFAFTSSTCSSTVQSCGYFLVDTNGFHGPNVVGKDIFRIWIRQDSLLPAGVGDALDCTTTGYGCASVYLQQ